MIPDIAHSPANTPARRVTDADAISLLYRMVSIPSLSGNEGVLALDLTMRMEEFGLRAQIDDAGNAIGSIGRPEARHLIVLLGHTDTVPGDVPVRLENDTLHGRGTVDAKGPLAAFIVAAARAQLPPDVRIDVIGAVEEESATSRGARHVALRPAPDACIIGEPSAWDGVTLGYKGRLLIDAVWRQPCSHSAGPHPTAADRAHEWWSRILQWVEPRNAGKDRAFERTQPTLRSITTASDGLEDRAHVTASFRLPPGTTPAEVESACREFARGAELTTRGPELAHVADRANPVVRALSSAIRSQGARPTHQVKTGTSDMNVVGPAWNCPIAAYGPGDSALDHTPHEHISLGEYLRACRVLQVALEHLCGELAGT